MVALGLEHRESLHHQDYANGNQGYPRDTQRWHCKNDWKLWEAVEAVTNNFSERLI